MSIRADIVAARTYQRPREDGSYESWSDVATRCIQHQRWLWERHGKVDEEELTELHHLLLTRKALLAGRTLWLGGTELIKNRQIASFNCSALKVETVHDLVDSFWLLLNGAGVGFIPVVGTLNGFSRFIPEVEVIRSHRKTKGGRAGNKETLEDGVWTLSLGDSGEAWAKSIGKLLAGKNNARKLVLDFSEIRPAGSRLAGYGWISAGDNVVAEEYPKIVKILNRRAGQLLTHIDILDIVNHIGVIQTGRRGAEIALYPYEQEGWYEFAAAKKDYWTTGNNQRSQSNNSLIFKEKPSLQEIRNILDLMVEAGGSEPGILNEVAMRKRAPWAIATNPCGEILLPNRGLCNLVEVNIAAFASTQELERAIYIMGRANYRQTLVNLDDGILQRSWHENNEFLRLCGVSLTGQVLREDLLTPYQLRRLRRYAWMGAESMAQELGTQSPKNVTTGKPSGTVSKIMDTTEGIHRPLGKYIFNNITFSRHDPLLEKLAASGYEIFENPLQTDGVVVKFPVMWSIEAKPWGALDQLNRYKLLMDHYVDQNQSITVSYTQEELPDIASWLNNNWDSYVGVSFLPRTDPSKSAQDLGYPYLPQEVVDKDTWEKYNKKIKVLQGDFTGKELDVEECAGGICPVK